MPPAEDRPNPVLVWLAFAAIYFLWGGTFLAIRFAVAEFPPLWLMGFRCLVGGGILYALGALGGEPAPALRQWRRAAVAGALFFLVGHGGLAWAEQHIASGVAALLFTTMPFWMILLDRMAGNPLRQPVRVGFGMVLGFAGVAVLLGAQGDAGTSLIRLAPAAVILASALSWALGSVYTRQSFRSAPVSRVTAMNLLAGGVLLFLAGAGAGEWSRLAAAVITWRGVASLGFLVFLGTLVTFTAYTWLLKVSTPARVGTYSFVNPVVAVLVGWALGEERLTAGILLATGIIVAGVILVVLSSRSSGPASASGKPMLAPASTGD